MPSVRAGDPFRMVPGDFHLKSPRAWLAFMPTEKADEKVHLISTHGLPFGPLEVRQMVESVYAASDRRETRTGLLACNLYFGRNGPWFKEMWRSCSPFMMPVNHPLTQAFYERYAGTLSHEHQSKLPNVFTDRSPRSERLTVDGIERQVIVLEGCGYGPLGMRDFRWQDLGFQTYMLPPAKFWMQCRPGPGYIDEDGFEIDMPPRRVQVRLRIFHPFPPLPPPPHYVDDGELITKKSSQIITVPHSLVRYPKRGYARDRCGYVESDPSVMTDMDKVAYRFTVIILDP